MLLLEYNGGCLYFVVALPILSQKINEWLIVDWEHAFIDGIALILVC
jgi:hypothetical protein